MKLSQLIQLFVAVLSINQVAAAPPKRSKVVTPPETVSQRTGLDCGNASSLTEHVGALQQRNQSAESPGRVLKDHRQHPRSKGVSSKTIFVASMAFATGCVDTVCFRRYKCFLGMMTGNTIRFATAVAEARILDALFHASLITSYAVGVGIFRVLDIKVRHGEKEASSSSQQLLTTVAPIILALFVLADMLAHWFDNNRIHAPLLSVGFGIMNAASADATGGTILYAMTGHITRMGRNIVDYFMLSKPKCLQSFKSRLRIVACFAAGIALSVKAAQYMMVLSSSVQPPLWTTAGVAFAALFLWYGNTLAA